MDEFLEKTYQNGTPPNPSELWGVYKIKMLTGIFPDLSRFGHIKKFYSMNSNVVGCNSFNHHFKWGYFKVYTSSKTVIDYDLKVNWFSRRIKDNVVTITPQKLYLGKFYYMIFGKPRFIGYFTMEKQINLLDFNKKYSIIFFGSLKINL